VSANRGVHAPPGVGMVAPPQVLRKAERSQGTKAKAASREWLKQTTRPTIQAL